MKSLEATNIRGQFSRISRGTRWNEIMVRGILTDRIRAVTLGSNFTARIFLISGGPVGGKGSQGTTRALILPVKAIQMQCSLILHHPCMPRKLLYD